MNRLRIFNYLIYSTIIFYLLLSCGKSSNKQNELSDKNSYDTLFRPVNKEVIRKDSTLSIRNKNIFISTKVETSMNESIIISYDKEIVFFRDNTFTIMIKSNNNLLILDTILTKNNFNEIIDKEFISKSIIVNGWLSSVKENKLEFELVIGVPETDDIELINLSIDSLNRIDFKLGEVKYE
jgi:hypothetical protein